MIINLTKNKIIAKEPVPAVSFASRGRGMIGRDFSGFDAMVFNRCNSIHTMLMSIKIDVIFIDRDNRICGLRKNLPPWRPFIRCGKAVSVIELPEGKIDETGTENGDILDLNAELTEEKRKKLKEQILPNPETGVVAAESH